MQRLDLSIRSSYAEFERLNSAIDRFLEENRVPDRESYAARLVVEELVSNVIRHGTVGDAPRAIDIRMAIEQGRLVVHVTDDGLEFDPTRVPAPPFDRPLRERRPGGLGIHLVRSMADGVRYERREERNHVEVVICIPEEA